MNDATIGALVVIVGLVLFAAGALVGSEGRQKTITDQCRDFGAFTVKEAGGSAKFDCAERPQ